MERKFFLIKKKKERKTEKTREYQASHTHRDNVRVPFWLQRPLSQTTAPVHALFATLPYTLPTLSGPSNPATRWIRQTSTSEGSYTPLYRSCLFTMRRLSFS